MFRQFGVCLSAAFVAVSLVSSFETSAEAGLFNRRLRYYITNSVKKQPAQKTHTTLKPVIPDAKAAEPTLQKMEQKAPTTQSKVKAPVFPTYGFSEYDCLGMNFSEEIAVLPGNESAVLKSVTETYKPDYTKTIQEKYPEARPEVQASLAKVAEAVHLKKTYSEIGKIVREVEVPVRQMKAHEILAINKELAPAIKVEEYRAIEELNKFRMRSGLRPCVIDMFLCTVSRGHSSDMRRLGFFSHNSPVSGKYNFSMRARQYGASASAENIYMGSTSGRAANHAWANSSGHRANMLGGFSRVGVGQVGGHFTQMFGR